jgi:hypothetical protein
MIGKFSMYENIFYLLVSLHRLSEVYDRGFPIFFNKKEHEVILAQGKKWIFIVRNERKWIFADGYLL